MPIKVGLALSCATSDRQNPDKIWTCPPGPFGPHVQRLVGLPKSWAQHAGVSFSTVRRGEDETTSTAVRKASRAAIAEALQKSDIRIAGHDGQVTLSKTV